MTKRVASALRYPVGGEGTERPLVASWLLVALSALVPLLPLLPLIGYLVRVLASSERGDSAPPFFRDPRGLLSRSLGGLAVLVAYLAVPLAGLLITVYGAIANENLIAGDAGTGALVYAGLTTVLFAGLIGAYLLPVALTGYGTAGSLRGAFDTSTLRRIGGHGAYFVGWCAGALALLAAVGVGRLLLAVPALGPLLGAFSVAYGLLLSAHVWGRAIGRASRFG